MDLQDQLLALSISVGVIAPLLVPGQQRAPVRQPPVLGTTTQTVDACSALGTWHHNLDTDADGVLDAYGDVVVLPAWNPALGTLVSVQVRAGLNFELDLGVEALTPLPIVLCGTDEVVVDGHLELASGPTADQTIDLGATLCAPGPFDGLIDFAGASGTMVFLGNFELDPVQHDLPVAPFLAGPVAVQGVSFDALHSSLSDGNLILAWHVQVRFCARVTFTYQPA